MTNQVKLHISKNPVDYVIIGIGLVGLIIAFILPVLHYTELPTAIPTHYGIDGQPDRFGSKDSIWLLPIISAIIFAGMNFLTKFPHHFNFPVKIDEINAKFYYTNSIRLLNCLNTSQVIIFLYINYQTIQVAQNKSGGLGTFFLVVFFFFYSSSSSLFLYS